ncbi:uncharacterized protein SRS1_11232 [Sporisorium reilianum f. sp. reilianum]|uniref:Uncharacterized protein n=1 Tax=Sporisorium reilianum f. sp. reilianum TaxID=72559 RepID=A0A2N8UGN0_9BASI|nr:uncharacterized protein SRS1_11232 [Sporisorium reilianum f. sp. reilianum]
MTPIWIRVVAILALVLLATASPVPANDAVGGSVPAQVSQSLGTNADPSPPARQRKSVRWAQPVVSTAGGASVQPELPVTGSPQPSRLTPPTNNAFEEKPFAAIPVNPISEEQLNHRLIWANDGTAYRTKAEYLKAIEQDPRRARPVLPATGDTRPARMAPPTESGSDLARVTSLEKKIFEVPEGMQRIYLVNGRSYSNYDEATVARDGASPSFLATTPNGRSLPVAKQANTNGRFWSSWLPSWRSTPRVPVQNSLKEVTTTLPAQAQAQKGWWQRLSEGAQGFMGRLASPARYFRGR